MGHFLAPAAVGRGRERGAPDRLNGDSLRGFSGGVRELFSFKHLFNTVHDTMGEAHCQGFLERIFWI